MASLAECNHMILKLDAFLCCHLYFALEPDSRDLELEKYDGIEGIYLGGFRLSRGRNSVHPKEHINVAKR